MLRRLRLDQGVTLVSLSYDSGVAPGTISRIERNKRVGQIWTLEALFAVLGYEIEAFPISRDLPPSVLSARGNASLGQEQHLSLLRVGTVGRRVQAPNPSEHRSRVRPQAV